MTVKFPKEEWSQAFHVHLCPVSRVELIPWAVPGVPTSMGLMIQPQQTATSSPTRRGEGSHLRGEGDNLEIKLLIGLTYNCF